MYRTPDAISLTPLDPFLLQCVALLLAHGTEAGCLGAGTGWGSCPAAPFRCRKLTTTKEIMYLVQYCSY